MSLRDLNWRKGFFRLWLLASSVWVIVTGSVWITKGCYNLSACSEMTFLPPIIALLLGMGFMWAFSGFVPKQNKVDETTQPE